MSQRYDIENLLADLTTIFQANLNTAIAAVEAEKIAMGLPATNLQPIDSGVGGVGTGGYFQQNWSFANLNVPVALFYGIEDIHAQGLGPATEQTYKIFVEPILVDGNQDKLGIVRILRYTRALQDVLHANWDQIQSSSYVKIEAVMPMSFRRDGDSSETIRVGGVSIVTALG